MATDYTFSVSLKNKTTNQTLQQSSYTVTGGDYEDAGIWQVTTSEVSHTINTDVGNAMAMMLVNLDANHFVEVGYATTAYDHKLLPGMPAIIPIQPTTATLYAKADTATVKLQYWIIEA